MFSIRAPRLISRWEILKLSRIQCTFCSCRYHGLHKHTVHQFEKAVSINKAGLKVKTLSSPSAYLFKRYLETGPKASSTIDEEDIKRFSALANFWWKENGEFEALHTLNELRIPLIRDALKTDNAGKDLSHIPQPLKGLKILDVGSGGGILSEPLARLGAFVIGVDASEENIRVAETHALQDPQVAKNVKYIHSSVEDLVGTEENSFDGVVASEIIEHVFNAPEFVTSCSKLVKPGGSLFLTTINKTYISYLLAVVGAENVLNIVPKGTHEWDKFISPSDLQYQLSQNGLSTKLVHGMCYNPLSGRWSWIGDVNINYALHAVKPLNSPIMHQSDFGTEQDTKPENFT